MKQHPIVALLAIVVAGIGMFGIAVLLQMALLPRLQQEALMQYYAAWVLAYLILIVVRLIPRH